MSETIVQIERLRKSYGPIVALDGVSLAIEKGTIFGLLGPNGAGKTTTIKILTTLARPDEGRATVAGVDLLQEPAKVRSLIGYVPQELTVDPYLTVREHMRYYGDLYHLPATVREAQARELLELLGLVGSEDRRVKFFSGGMKKKLDLACGLLHRPPVILLDEPSLGLDVHVRREVWDHILRLRDQGTTVLLCTNYMDEAERLCDRLAIIDHGRIVVTGTPGDLRGQLKKDVVSIEVERVEQDHGGAVRTLQAALSNLEGVQGTVADGTRIRVYVESDEKALLRILDTARTVNIPIHSITHSRPGLDEVFLQHTGHPLDES
ncbi:MAG: ATP-binding cassette domain-containing protein [Deltaproteobacteria bacterium]|nr:ATP-binding cassette domain-containing protein [Deltaproteobacteria bacterium]